MVGASATSWNFKITIVNTVYENNQALIGCMEKIQSTSRQFDTITKAGALLRLLHDPKFVFRLSVFYRLMYHISILYPQLQQGAIDFITVKRCITEFEKNIKQERNNIRTVKLGKEGKQKREVPMFRRLCKLRKCDTILAEIKRRFAFIGHFEIEHLFSVEN